MIIEKSVPTKPNERIHVLDIIRGIALFGILMVNIANFSSPSFYEDLAGIKLWSHPVDQATEWFIGLFFEGKFYTMFSFLFGIGMVIFWERAQKKAGKPGFLYLRRMLVLLCIGVIHAIFIWSGDILITYALIGIILILFRNVTAKTTITWAFWLLLVPIAVMFLLNGLVLLVQDRETLAVMMQGERTMFERAMHAYGEGTYLDTIQQRIADLKFLYSFWFFEVPSILAMFLFGVAAAKKGIIYRIDEHLPFIQKIWQRMLLLGILFGGLHLSGQIGRNPAEPDSYDLLYLFGLLSGPVLCFFYVTSITLIWQRSKGNILWQKIGAVGRLGITNYLMQSLICTTLFYHYGFDLYGKVSPVQNLGIVMTIYGFQIVFSNLWFRKYTYGPIEWVWRKLTYGKIL